MAITIARLLSLTLLCFSIISLGSAFVVKSTRRWTQARPRPRSSQRSTLNLFWFQSKDSKKKNDDDSTERRPKMGGVVSVMDSMDSFKKAQKAGKMTEAIVQELSTVVVEGVAADGKVKVYFDGQQRPKGVDIDESYLSGISGRDLCAALTDAMQDAHASSREKMDEKMKAFYAELGLPASP